MSHLSCSQVDRAEEQQNVDVKVTSKKIRAEQEKELKQFRESLKQEVKLMKQEVELQTPKDRRKDELKRRKEMLERDQQRRVRASRCLAFKVVTLWCQLIFLTPFFRSNCSWPS